jgi:hypothetical protein
MESTTHFTLNQQTQDIDKSFISCLKLAAEAVLLLLSAVLFVLLAMARALSAVATLALAAFAFCLWAFSVWRVRCENGLLLIEWLQQLVRKVQQS